MKCFVRYALARYALEREASAFRTYMADAVFFAGQNKAINIRFNDWLHPAPPDKRTGEEIIETMKNKLKMLEVK